MPKELSIKAYEDDLKKGKGPRLYSTKIAQQVLEDDWDPKGDPTLEQWIKEEERKRGMNTKAPVFIPGTHKIRAKARKSMRKLRKVSRKSRKISRKTSRKSRKVSRKTSRKSRKVSRKSRKTSRKTSRKSRKTSRKTSRKSRKASRRSLRSKSRRVSRRKSMGKERACKDLLKEKVGINLKEYEDGRYVSRQQAIAVAYSQVKKMKPSCGKYFKRK